MHIQTQKLPSFNRIKSADNVPGLKFQLERQLTKESLLVNGFTWIIEPKINKNNERYGGLALGTFKPVQIDQQLIKYNFGAVVSVFKQRNVFINPKIKHLRVFLPDNSKENVQSVFDSSYRFINSNLSKTNVFVYCQNGISKSPIIVAAYLMRQKNIEANSALQEIKKKRKTVMPNETFYSELIEYEKQLSQPKETGRQMCIIM